MPEGAESDSEPVEVVLWDFGGVFTESPFHRMGDYAAQLATTADFLVDTVLGYSEPDGDHPWHRLERGEVAMADAFRDVEALAAAAGLTDFRLVTFFQSLGSAAERRDAMFARVRRLHARGIRHAIVSNNIAELGDRWRSMLPGGLFEHIIDSSAVGCRKPDPAIYRLALERMATTPSRAVFLDDHVENVESARRLGLRSILVGPDPLEAVAVLEEMVASAVG